VTLLVVAGPPGAGKSTVGRLLADGGPLSVHLHSDDFYTWIVRGYVEPWKPASLTQNITLLSSVALAAGRLAEGGYLTVVDGVFGPWFLDPWRALETPVHYVVLRPSLDATRDRAADRPGHPLQDLDVVTQMHNAFADIGELEHHAIDSTDLTPEATAAEVLRRLTAGDLLLT
jgi:gluconate kinase